MRSWARASRQSEVLTGREELETRLAEAEARFPGEVPRPEHWGGFLVAPETIEFWQGRRHRLHDRFRYTARAGVWRMTAYRPSREGSDPMDANELRRRVADGMPQTIDDLARLVAIPSVGHAGFDPANVRASAERVRDILAEAGVADARLLELDGGLPPCSGRSPGPEGAPTLLLYAHHDVQPEGDASAWTTPPFQPEIRGGRMYGRGSADDKSGVAVHAAALRALGAHEGASLPVTVKLLVEGEEECTTEHLPELVGGNTDLLRADIAVIADGGNVRTGVPTVDTSVRGVTDCTITVSVMPIAQHSGSYGGPVPDAITALSRDIASFGRRRRGRNDRGAPLVHVGGRIGLRGGAPP